MNNMSLMPSMAEEVFGPTLDEYVDISSWSEWRWKVQRLQNPASSVAALRMVGKRVVPNDQPLCSERGEYCLNDYQYDPHASELFVLFMAQICHLPIRVSWGAAAHLEV